MKKLLFVLLFGISTSIFANPIQLVSSTVPISTGATSLGFTIPSSIVPPSQLSLPSVIPSGVLSVVFGALIPAIISKSSGSF